MRVRLLNTHVYTCSRDSVEDILSIRAPDMSAVPRASECVPTKPSTWHGDNIVFTVIYRSLSYMSFAVVWGLSRLCVSRCNAAYREIDVKTIRNNLLDPAFSYFASLFCRMYMLHFAERDRSQITRVAARPELRVVVDTSKLIQTSSDGHQQHFLRSVGFPILFYTDSSQLT